MNRRRAAWNKDEIIEKIQEWVERYGEIPAATDWNPSDCNKSARISLARADRWMQREKRFREGEWPWPRTVQKRFGSWNNAIEAAGFKPRRESMPPMEPAKSLPDAIEEIERLITQAGQARTNKLKREHMMVIAQIAMSTLPVEES